MKNMRICARGLLPILAAAALASGCFQLEYDIALHAEDDGATVTERLGLTLETRELDAGAPPGESLERYLDESAVLQRLKQMGEGVVLKEHRRVERPDGGIESVAVFDIPDVAKLRLPNPLVDGAPPGSMLRLEIKPIALSSYGVVSGQRAAVSGLRVGGGNLPGPLPAVRPLDTQAYRDLGPACADMMRGLSVFVRVTVPTTVTGGVERNAGAGGKTITFFSLTDTDTDGSGRLFLSNEEVMLALLRGDPASGAIGGSTGFVHNDTVPVLRLGRYRGVGAQMLFTPQMERKWKTK